ncbi:hypothetical protein [Streptomyces sp. SAJ15]|uniref:hypothetical protein n=1 Tax=Streptomyces sp. SAJ15 TaxID=2011095 RepID=UPI001185C196|nr:hypothetical protein [Streptomyces sp. SAJ15]TVL94150.1 hypothetical protein CD790_03900 [Streptomyces sp. SAJ15]
MHDELTHSLTSSRPRLLAEKVRERGSPGIPLNTGALEVRSDICGVLASWVAVVSEARRVPSPTRNTPALLAFLAEHAGWLADHEAAGDLVAETDELVRAAWTVLSGRTDRNVPVGTCVRPGCGGTLVAHLDAAAPSGRPSITCSVDHAHTWSSEMWHTLHEAPPRPGRAVGLTARDISTGWHIASGTVYWLANTHRWRRRRNGRQVLYDRDDVLATMRARTAAAQGAECVPGA